MTTRDGRSLSPSAQEELRKRAAKVVRTGMPQTQTARVFGVSRRAVCSWVRQAKEGGIRRLAAKKRGRPCGIRLSPDQVQQAKRLIRKWCPDQLDLSFVLWTREAVRQLLVARFAISLSVSTVGRYLKHWGFTPQKPLRRAYEQDPRKVRRWLEEEYPAIRPQARREKGQIHWGDAMGLRSDHQTGCSYGVKGHTPVIRGTGKRFRCNMLSTITPRGQLTFMVFTGNFNWKVLLKFLRRLVRQAEAKIFLIMDRHPAHRKTEVQKWLANHAHQIQRFFLPPYSPELNPDEMLNHDVKSNALGRKRSATQQEMIVDLRAYLRRRQHQPEVVKRYFHAPSVRYATA